MKVIRMVDDRIEPNQGGFRNQTTTNGQDREARGDIRLGEQLNRVQKLNANRGKGDITASADEDEEDPDDKGLPTWLRIVLWLMRKSIVPIIMIIMLVLGLYVGYVILGKQPKGEVFEWSTWRHLYDLIFAES